MNHDADGIGDLGEDRPLSPSIKAAIDSVTPAAASDSFWSELDRKLDVVDAEGSAAVDGDRIEADQSDRAELGTNVTGLWTTDESAKVDSEPPLLHPGEAVEHNGRGRFLAVAALVLFAAGLAFVLLQGQGTSTEPAEGGLPEPSVLMAEDMAVKVQGEPEPGAWLIWRPGYIEDEVVFPTDGTYEFVVVASGRFSSGGEFGPDLEVLVDSVTVDGSQPVTLDGFVEYRFVGQVEAGTHTVGVSNTLLSQPTRQTNDAGFSPLLVVDRVTISPVLG